jgi:2-C-methyl-D-erythritol 4-phosphate cytidylyltransferase/2-C-methyl-D-erythritol 2,4-cyclodiphosphate synthase
MGGSYAIIVAAGRGERLGGGEPKQYRKLGGRPLLSWSLTQLLNHPAVDQVRCVIGAEDGERFAAASAGLDCLPPVVGGAIRQESVRLGLESLEEFGPSRVLIHDAARPFLAEGMLESLLAALADHEGALPALPVVDSLRRDDAGLCGEVVERDGLIRAQTPQAFRYPEILEAHRAFAAESFTDDAALARAAGLSVALTPGSERAFKITTREDLERAEEMLASRRETRVGQGLDVHRLIPGDGVMLCGVKIAHDKRLEGHSDADVGLHAIVDAILGALGKGDIGQHFPPSDPQWKGADSALFVAEARRLLEAASAQLINLDVTLICESPKIGPHRQAMGTRIAQLLQVEAARINVKATTTERLGFAGRGEGIAAQASVAVSLPAADRAWVGAA